MAKSEPAAALELGAAEIERQVEDDQVAGEVGLELRGRIVENGVAAGQPENRTSTI